MKNFIILMIFFSCLEVSAQIDTIPMPPGYTLTQTRQRTIIRIAPNNNLWIGFSRIGAGEYNGSTWKMYNDTNGLPSNYVTAFAFDSSITWIGTDKGLVKTDGLNLVSFNTLNSPLPSNKINYLYIADTTLWIGTDSGAVSFSGNHWFVYNKTNSPLASDTILCFNENSFGLYISSVDNLLVLTSNGWKHVAPDLSPVFRLTSDLQGNLYHWNYRIKDTLFTNTVFPTNPCMYYNLQTQPTYYLGSKETNKVYACLEAIGSFGFQETLIYDLDSMSTINNSYFINMPFQLDTYDTLKLWDINSSGEYYTTKHGFWHVLKINLNALVSLSVPDSCPYLDVNQVRARIWNNGSLFWDMVGNSLYEVPKSTGKSPIFCEGLWIGGLDAQGKLHIAAQTYRQSGNDFWPGPLDTTNAKIDSSTYQQYDKLWKIDKYTVLNFIFNYQNGNVTSGAYPVPDIILNWPVHGSGNYSRSMAPFVDTNTDGIYNPYDGDYPDIKGDQFFWWMFNDNYSSHGETESLYNLGVEIHGSAYAYNCPQLVNGDSVVNYTTFYHYDFINRSDTDYHDVYVGIYSDVDLGNYLDDYVGCDTTLDIAFVYNGENDDEGLTGYGVNPPMFNLALLEGPEPILNDGRDNDHDGATDEAGEKCMMNYFIYWNSDPSNIGDPNTANHYYQRIQGRWKDNSHIVYGCTGYDPSSTHLTNYMFSGPVYDTIGWSENHSCGNLANTPSDRRVFVSSGPIELRKGEKRSIDFAYIFTREPNLPNGPSTSLAVNRDQVMRIKNFFETDSFPCNQLIGIDEIRKNVLMANLYPNPAHSEIYVTLLNNEPGIKSFFITDVLGKDVIGRTKFMSTSFRIDLTRLSPGVYFLHVKSGDRSCVKRFIVE